MLPKKIEIEGREFELDIWQDESEICPIGGWWHFAYFGGLLPGEGIGADACYIPRASDGEWEYYLEVSSRLKKDAYKEMEKKIKDATNITQVGTETYELEEDEDNV